MKKSVSPVFAAIVIIVALALGALYFMVRYRAHEARWEAESRALQQQADRAIQSGRSRSAGPGMRSRGRDGGGRRAGSAEPSPEGEPKAGAPQPGE